MPLRIKLYLAAMLALFLFAAYLDAQVVGMG
jgi:hypothetical protein